MSRRNTFLSDSERDGAIELWHAMHREAEFSCAELKTQEWIRNRRSETMGSTPFTISASASKELSADRSDRPPCVALLMRDQSQEAREDLSYYSQANGVVHACGHNMHGSIARGTALAFHRLRESFADGGARCDRACTRRLQYVVA